MSTPDKIAGAYLETVELRKKYAAAIEERSAELAKELGPGWYSRPGVPFGGGLPVPGARLMGDTPIAWIAQRDDGGYCYSGPAGIFPISIENARAGVWESTP